MVRDRLQSRALAVGTIAALTLFAFDISFSAEIWHGRPETRDGGTIYLKGTITKDDPARFRAVYAEIRELLYQEVRLNSYGGDVFAAIDIGRQIRAESMRTTVDSRCVSACVFIYAGGVSRLALADHELGIHRPYSIDTGVASLSDADKRYKQLDALVHAYFKEMNVSDQLADDILRIEPENVKFLTFAEAQRYGLEGQDPAQADLSVSRMATMYGISSKQEYFKRTKRVELDCSPLPLLAKHTNAEVEARVVCEESIMWGISQQDYSLRRKRLGQCENSNNIARMECQRAVFHGTR